MNLNREENTPVFTPQPISLTPTSKRKKRDLKFEKRKKKRKEKKKKNELQISESLLACWGKTQVSRDVLRWTIAWVGVLLLKSA